MALDEKPKETHPATPVVVLYFLLIVFTILMAIFSDFSSYVRERFGFDLNSINSIFSSKLSILKTISTYLSLVLLTLLIYAYIRLKQVNAEDKKKFGNHYELAEGEFPKNERWEKILTLTNSENPSDWRQAIIEADVILDEIVSAQGYQGESLGEKMKGIEPSDFNTLDQAWEAHKVRNRIAHDGGDFVLTEREAKRVVRLYEQVLKEFQYI